MGKAYRKLGEEVYYLSKLTHPHTHNPPHIQTHTQTHTHTIDSSDLEKTAKSDGRPYKRASIRRSILRSFKTAEQLDRQKLDFFVLYFDAIETDNLKIVFRIIIIIIITAIKNNHVSRLLYRVKVNVNNDQYPGSLRKNELVGVNWFNFFSNFKLLS